MPRRVISISPHGSLQTVDASDHAGAFVLTVDRNGTAATATNLTNVTSNDELIIVDSVAGDDRLVLTIPNGSTVTVANPFGGGAGSISVIGAASITKDTLTLVLDHSSDATDIDLTGANAFTITDVEIITIKSEGATSTSNEIQQLITSAGSTVNVESTTKLTLGLKSAVSAINISGSGKQDVSFQAVTAYAEGKNLTIEATGATSETTIDLANCQGRADGSAEKGNITGIEQKDTITTSDNADVAYVIDAGAGDDVVTLYTANAASANVTLAAGTNELKNGDVVGTNHVIVTDFQLVSGGDKLSVNTAAAMTFGGMGTASVDNQLVILDTAVAEDDAARTAVQDIIAANDEKAVILINNTNGVAEL